MPTYSARKPRYSTTEFAFCQQVKNAAFPVREMGAKKSLEPCCCRRSASAVENERPVVDGLPLVHFDPELAAGQLCLVEVADAGHTERLCTRVGRDIDDAEVDAPAITDADLVEVTICHPTIVQPRMADRDVSDDLTRLVTLFEESDSAGTENHHILPLQRGAAAARAATRRK